MASASDLLYRFFKKVGLHRTRVLPWRGRVDGTRVRVPLATLQALPYFVAHEPWLDAVLTRVLARFPGLFVDVGMNLGQTLIKVKAVEPARPVLGFEPNPACLGALHDLVRLNRYTDVRILPVALGDTDGVARLDLFDGPVDGSASMIGDFRSIPVERTQHIACLRWTTVERSVPTGPIGVVKIDVEGAEALVLAGMEERLRSDRPAVVVEILPVYEAANTGRLQRQEALEALIRRADYRTLRIDRHDPTHMGLVEVPEIGIISELQLGNYILAPVERVPELMAAF